MKHLVIVFFSILFFENAWCTIHTVSASAGYPAQYNKISLAYQAASSGDTIIIHPGHYNDDFNLNKSIVFIGAGLNPKNNNKTATTLYGLIYLQSGASGSVFMGIDFQRTLSETNQVTDNLVLSDCRFRDGAVTLRGNNILVENCIFQRGLNFTLENAKNNIVRNSVFNSGPVGSESSLWISFGTNTSVLNNIFTGSNANTIAIKRSVHYMPIGGGVLIANNIFYNVDAFDAGNTGDCNYQNNIYHLSTNPIPAGNNNIMANPAFEGYPAGGDVFDFKYSFKLAANSPARGHGIGGADAGIWGGAFSVNEGWEPPIPRIQKLEVKNPIVPPGGTLQVTLSGNKAN